MDDPTDDNELPIVVGVDGSPDAILALQWAKKLAESIGTTIKAVSVWQLEVVYGPYAVSDWDGETVAREVLDAALTDAFGDSPPEGLNAETYRGNPAKVLLEQSRSAQMLVVGSRGRGGFAGLLLGSVSSSCASHAKCPVLVVHAAGEPSKSQPRQGSHS